MAHIRDTERSWAAQTGHMLKTCHLSNMKRLKDATFWNFSRGFSTRQECPLQKASACNINDDSPPSIRPNTGLSFRDTQSHSHICGQFRVSLFRNLQLLGEPGGNLRRPRQNMKNATQKGPDTGVEPWTAVITAPPCCLVHKHVGLFWKVMAGLF